jgi:hypothetical protein
VTAADHPVACPHIGRGSGRPCGQPLHRGRDEVFMTRVQVEWSCLAGHTTYSDVALPDIDAYGRPRRQESFKVPTLTDLDRALLAQIMTEPLS